MPYDWKKRREREAAKLQRRVAQRQIEREFSDEPEFSGVEPAEPELDAPRDEFPIDDLEPVGSGEQPGLPPPDLPIAERVQPVAPGGGLAAGGQEEVLRDMLGELREIKDILSEGMVGRFGP